MRLGGNAFLRALAHRDPEEPYREDGGLAAGAGIKPDDTRAVRGLDRNARGARPVNPGGRHDSCPVQAPVTPPVLIPAPMVRARSSSLLESARLSP